MSIRIVAVAGYGNLGTHIVRALLASNFIVTILTRDASHPQPPSAVTVHHVDYTSPASLRHALHGADALVVSLASHALAHQYLLIDAALAAGVRHYIPSEYGNYSVEPAACKLPTIQFVMDVQRYLIRKCAESGGGMTYTIVAPGAFLNYVLNTALVADFAAKKIAWYDGGGQGLSASRLGTVGKAVAAVLADVDAFRNRVVKVHDCVVTQRGVWDIIREVEGESIAQWTQEDQDVGTVMAEGLRRLAEGADGQDEDIETAVQRVMGPGCFAREYDFVWEPNDNAALGLPREGAGVGREVWAEWVRRRVRGEIVDVDVHVGGRG